MLVIHHPDQARHDVESVFRTGRFIPHVERAERYRIFLDAVTSAGHEVAEAPRAGLEAITAVHDPAYVEFLKGLHDRWRQRPDFGPVAVPSVHPTHRMHRRPTDLIGELGWYSNSTTCPIGAETWISVLASAQVAIHAAERLTTADAPVYAMCRPPGHHAYPDLMSGGCYLNNTAIAAQLLTRRFGRVAILDIDVHHGNGTQAIFWDRADVLTCSVHVNPHEGAPLYAGHADEVGGEAARGFNDNQPLPRGTGDATWLAAIGSALARIRGFEPGALVIALGFDAAEHDPVATFRITEEGFARAAAMIAAAGCPTLLVQEGGYISASLGRYLQAFLGGMERGRGHSVGSISG